MTFKEIRKEFQQNIKKIYSSGKAIPAALCERETGIDIGFKPAYVYPIVTKLRKAHN